jgi:hypothetical protein
MQPTIKGWPVTACHPPSIRPAFESPFIQHAWWQWASWRYFLYRLYYFAILLACYLDFQFFFNSIDAVIFPRDCELKKPLIPRRYDMFSYICISLFLCLHRLTSIFFFQEQFIEACLARDARIFWDGTLRWISFFFPFLFHISVNKRLHFFCLIILTVAIKFH